MSPLARAFIVAALLTAPGKGQSLEDRLDEDRYLRGLTELQLPDVLEQYIADHADAAPDRQAAYEIARHRIVLAGQGTGPKERRAAVEAILGIRAALIEDQPGHPDRATWRADHGADLLFELLPIDGAGVTLLVGVPSAAQRKQVERVAAELDRHMSRAELEVEQAILALDGREDANSLELLSRQRRLIEQERDRRIPFLRGIGAYLQAALLPPDARERDELNGLAADSLEPLLDDLEGAVGARARLYYGLSLAGLGEHDAAAALLAEVAGDDDAHVSDRFVAQISPVVLRRGRGHLDGTAQLFDTLRERGDWPEGVFFQLLLADQSFLIARDAALQQSSGRTSPQLRDAYADWIAALEETLADLA